MDRVNGRCALWIFISAMALVAGREALGQECQRPRVTANPFGGERWAGYQDAVYDARRDRWLMVTGSYAGEDAEGYLWTSRDMVSWDAPSRTPFGSWIRATAYDDARDALLVVTPTGAYRLVDGVWHDMPTPGGSATTYGMYYDPLARRTVAHTSSGFLAWDGESWRAVEGEFPPTTAEAAFDPVRGVLVFGSGHEWDGRAWRTLPFSGVFEPGIARVTYDARRGGVLFLGNALGSQGFSVYLWNGSEFSFVIDALPPPHHGSLFGGFVSSADDGVFLLCGNTNSLYRQVWKLGEGWSLAASAPVCPRSFRPAIVSIPERERALMLFARADPCGGQTWVFDGAWTPRPSPGPAFASSFTMAYDARRGRVVTTGTESAAGPLYLRAATYEWDGSGWELLHAASHITVPALAFHPVLQRVVGVSSVGGVPRLSAWDGGEWVSLGPAPAHPYNTLVFDEARGELLAVGWEENVSAFDGAAWRVLRGARPWFPSAPTLSAVGFDPIEGRVLALHSQSRLGVWIDAWMGDRWERRGPIDVPGADRAPGAWDSTAREFLLRAPVHADAPMDGLWRISPTDAVRITEPARVEVNCRREITGLFVGVDAPVGTSVQWYRAANLLQRGVPVALATTASVVFDPPLEPLPVYFWCEFTTPCGRLSSGVARPGLACGVDLDDGSGEGACDGVVNTLDLIYFLSLYGAGDARADLDGDLGVDVGDLVWFLERYEAGC